MSVGAQVNRKNKYGKTAIMYAAQGGHVEVIKYLIEVGADCRLQDKV